MGILEKLIIITLILFPFGELARINIAENVTLHPVDICIFLILIIWLSLQLKNKRNILKIKDVKAIAVFSLIALISLLINLYWLKLNEVIISVLYLIRWLSYASIYFAIRDSSANFKNKTLFRILIIDGLVIVIVGFIQLFFYPNLINLYQYGWDKHIYRMFSVFLDPNFAGAFFVLYLLFTVGLAFENINKKIYKLAGIYAIIAGITLIAIFMTYSRSALVMFLVSSFTFFILIKKKKFILFIVGITFLYVIIASPRFYIENVNLFRINSSIERIESANIAIKIIEKNPIFGVGFNAYRYALVKYNLRSLGTKYPSHADAGTDNSFLFITATAGIAGLISYLYLWFLLLKRIYQKSREKNNFFASAVLSSAIGLTINAQFINSLFFGSLMLWMWVVLSVTDSKKQ